MLSLASLAVFSAAIWCGTAGNAIARDAAPAAQQAYTETIPGTSVKFDMVPIPGGTFRMGSPAAEAGRGQDEGPQADVTIHPFWMAAREVTWAEFDRFRRDKKTTLKPAGSDADAATRPSPPYGDDSRGFGKGKQPAIGMTWHAAAEYCRWLSAVTGHHYRLPTEAEWEYAARAGSTGAWSSGDEASLDGSAWYAANATSRPHPVGSKKPNAWGLYDMMGNVSEWTIDRYDATRYASLKGKDAVDPVNLPGAQRYPHVLRGGSFEDDPAKLRSAARRASQEAWSRRDPQQPRSIWWHPDASFVGFRVVRVDSDSDTLKDFKSRITRESPSE